MMNYQDAIKATAKRTYYCFSDFMDNNERDMLTGMAATLSAIYGVRCKDAKAAIKAEINRLYAEACRG